MKTNRKLLALFLAVILCLSFISGCSNNTPTNNNSTTNSDTPANSTTDSGSTSLGQSDIRNVYTDGVKIAYIPLGMAAASAPATVNALKHAVKDFSAIKIDVFDPNYDLNRQITLLNDCATQGYDAIILCALDSAALNPTVTEIETMGIPIITEGNTVTAIHTAYVAADSHTVGEAAGQALQEKMGNEGNVVLLDVPVGNLDTVFLGKGLEDFAKENTNWNIIAYANIEAWSTENAATAMRDFLTMYDDINAVFAVYDDMAIGAMQAIKSAGRDKDGILIYGQEGTTAMLEYIKSGEVAGTVFKDTFDIMSSIVNMALYAIQLGITGTNSGFSKTPEIKSTADIIDIGNVEAFSYIKRW